MKFKQWIIGTMAAGLWLGAAQAAPMPVTPAPAIGSNVETVQYYYGPPRRYAPPPRYRYAPQPYYGRRTYAPRAYYPAPRPAYRYARPAPRYYGPPRVYSKQQVRDWNRRHGL